LKHISLEKRAHVPHLFQNLALPQAALLCSCRFAGNELLMAALRLNIAYCHGSSLHPEKKEKMSHTTKEHSCTMTRDAA